MTSRRKKGRFRDKHPAGTTVDVAVMDAVASKLTNHNISCKTAFAIADKLSVSPSIVGIAIDLQDGHIRSCQLGLFGRRKIKNQGNGLANIDDTLRTEIRALLQNGRLPCQSAWQLAEDRNLSRLEIGKACELLEIRISQCQLGAFE